MDKVKEIVKKYGNYIELGGFVLTFIAVFLPFVTVSFWGISASAAIIKVTMGVFILIFAIFGIALVAIDTFAKSVFENARKNKTIALVLDYTPLGLAFLSFLFNLIKGIQSATEYSHLNVGFYFILIATLVCMCVRVVKCFFLKKEVKVEQPTQEAAN